MKPSFLPSPCFRAVLQFLLACPGYPGSGLQRESCRGGKTTPMLLALISSCSLSCCFPGKSGIWSFALSFSCNMGCSLRVPANRGVPPMTSFPKEFKFDFLRPAMRQLPYPRGSDKVIGMQQASKRRCLQEQSSNNPNACTQKNKAASPPPPRLPKESPSKAALKRGGDLNKLSSWLLITCARGL